MHDVLVHQRVDEGDPLHARVRREQDGLQLRVRAAAELDDMPEVSRQHGIVAKLGAVVLVPIG
eukprot:4764797-Prymnesium_polylepis.2